MPDIHRLVRIIGSLVIAGMFIAHAGGWVHWGLLGHLENRSYDARLNLTLPDTPDEGIVVIDIDEHSLNALGRWPWPRHRIAQLIDQLHDNYNIQAVGMDVVFAEPDEGRAFEELRELIEGGIDDYPLVQALLESLRPLLGPDHRLARSIRGRDVILGYYFKPPGGAGAETTSGRLPEPVLKREDVEPAASHLMHAAGYGANLSLLQEAAHGGGFFDNPLVDPDGVYRRAALIQAYGDGIYESLALAMARQLVGAPPLELVTGTLADDGPPELEAIEFGGFRVPVDHRGGAFVPYRGGQGSFPYVSAIDVLRGHAPKDLLDDRIAIVGASAPGLKDERSTPVQNVYPGVEIHANLLSGILTQSFLTEPPYREGFEIAAVAALGLIGALLFTFLTPLWIALVTVILIIGITMGNLVAWQTYGLVLPLASLAMVAAALFVFHSAYGFFVENRARSRLTRLFGQYVPPELVNEMNRRHESFALEGDSREMSVLFADIRGFTSIAEQLEPREVTQLINALLTPLTEVIHEHRGTIDKYLGDAVMAFWGAPLSDPDHARHSVRAAVALVRRVTELAPELEGRGWPVVRIGVGVNTGIMNVGNMGSRFRMAYTVVGDAVNLGSRLEGLTKYYGTDVLVSEITRAQVPDFVYREIDRVRVRGKEQPLSIFEPVCEREYLDGTTAKSLNRYHQALALFRNQEWDEAEEQFKELRRQEPGRAIHRIYLERIRHFRTTPPDSNWDGVFIHTAK